MRPEGCNSEPSTTTRPKIADNSVNNNIKKSEKLSFYHVQYTTHAVKKPTLLRLAFTHSETTSRTYSKIIQILFDPLFSFFIFLKNALHKLPRPCCPSCRPGIPLGSCSPEKQGQCCEHRCYTLRIRHKHFWFACSLRLKRWYVLRFRPHRVAAKTLRDGCNK